MDFGVRFHQLLPGRRQTFAMKLRLLELFEGDTGAKVYRTLAVLLRGQVGGDGWW